MDLLPWLFRSSFFVKKESVGYARLPPQAKILPVLLKQIFLTLRFSFVGECNDFLQCFVTIGPDH